MSIHLILALTALLCAALSFWRPPLLAVGVIILSVLHLLATT